MTKSPALSDYLRSFRTNPDKNTGKIDMSKNDETATATHAFSIGQTVQLKARSGTSTPEMYNITRKLPLEGAVPKYRVQSFREQHERVIAQDLIEAVGSSPSSTEDQLNWNTFRDITKIKTSARANNQRSPWARK